MNVGCTNADVSGGGYRHGHWTWTCISRLPIGHLRNSFIHYSGQVEMLMYS